MLIKDIYVDLQNYEQPYQEFTEIRNPTLSRLITAQLSLNELDLQDGSIGLFEGQSEPEEYLSLDTTIIEDSESVVSGHPSFKFSIELGKNKVIQKRQAYSLFDLLGDFGGFNDAIIFLISLPMSFYSSAIYSQHISSLFRVNKNHKRQRNSKT